MAEYIERESFRKSLLIGSEYLDEDTMMTVVNVLDCFPAADVAPVRHGRWDDEHKCTVCHNEAFFKISDIRPDYDYDWGENLVETGDYIWDIEWVETAYCPNCGAKMDLED